MRLLLVALFHAVCFSEKGGVLDMSRAVTSIELEEPAEDDSLHTKYRERMHIMV